MADQQILMTVPKEIIDANVKAAVVNALNRDPEKLVRAVVDAAMQEKDRNNYRNETVWDQTVNAMIRGVAMETFSEWLNEQKPMIAATVRERLAKKDKARHTLADEITEKLTAALGRFEVNIHCIKE